jgi:small subunit ribosomal protein S1
MDPVDVRANVEVKDETPRDEKTRRFKEWTATQTAGRVVEATVTSLTEFGAFAAVAPGVEGLIHISELSWRRVEHPADVLWEGAPVRVLILDVDEEDGTLGLSVKRLERHPFDVFVADRTQGDVVPGRVRNLESYGAFVEVAPGVEGLLHVSELAWSHVEDPSDVLSEGDVIETAIIEIDPEKRELRLSVKQTLPHPFDVFTQSNGLGSTVPGRVTNVVKYGAFVEVAEGVEGLVHISELAWGHVDNPSDVVVEGQAVAAEIIEVDRANQKLRLSIKATQPDPFDVFVGRTGVGARVPGRVTTVVKYGAFVEVAKGVEGLVHVSELAWDRTDRPSDVVSEGDAVHAKIIGVDPTRRQLKLSMKQAQLPPFDRFAAAYGVGDIVAGTVVTIKEELGAFVRVAPGVEGLVHISQLAPYRVVRVSDVVTLGQRVNVRILQLDESRRRLGLSLKAVTY